MIGEVDGRVREAQEGSCMVRERVLPWEKGWRPSRIIGSTELAGDRGQPPPYPRSSSPIYIYISNTSEELRP